MRYAEIIKELFDTKYDMRWDEQPDVVFVEFSAHGWDYIARFDEVTRDAWTFEFSLIKSKGDRERRHDLHTTTGVARSGTQWQVFPQVVQMLERFFAQRRPGALMFGAEKHPSSRVRLYDHMLVRLGQQLSNMGYHVTRIDKPGYQNVYYRVLKDGFQLDAELAM